MDKLNLILKNRSKILGRNERYLDYIRISNLRKAIHIADDKVLTKEILGRYNIPVPKKLAIIKDLKSLEDFNFDLLPKSIVVKPVHGVRGSGIEIFYNRDKDGQWIKSNGSRWSTNDVKGLCREIIDGKFSLFNEPDVVLIEERVKSHNVFKPYTYKGAPDVRIIVYNNIPIMSYVRIPTRASNGKANLDLGAIGTGIDMAVGKTTSAIIGKGTSIEYVPETNLPLSGIKIPYWDRILRYAIEASKATNLGYAAVDFLIDRDFGPLVVELNARPGLSIQIANDDGLRWRLRKAKGLKVKTTERGVRLAKDLFGGEIEEELEAISGKNVIGIYESVKVIGINKKEHLGKAKIDTGADSTSVDINIAKKLGYEEVIEAFDKITIPEKFSREEGVQLMHKYRDELVPKYEQLVDINLIHSSHGMSLRPYVVIELELDGTKFETKATLFDRSKLTYPIIIGRKSLGKFLVDPSK
jgi:alpha-L-glutamate ligase-like protein